MGEFLVSLATAKEEVRVVESCDCPSVPETLTMTITDGVGDCACAVGSITLTYDEISGTWINMSAVICSNPRPVVFSCDGAQTFRLNIDSGTVNYASVVTCSPFLFELINVYMGAVCENNATITIS